MPLIFIDLVGFLAGGLVFLTFCMRTMIALRLTAVLSNVAFVAYGLGAGLYPILILHGLLLPMNLIRSWQQIASTRRLQAAAVDTLSVLPLLPYMTLQKTTDGQVLFSKGDSADRLYCVSRGEVLIEEVGKRLSPGTLFGEVGVFADDRLRTGTARCIGAGQVCWVERATIIRLHRDNPEFGLTLTRLIASRFAENR